MNVGYFKRKSYKNADGEEIGYTGGTIMIPFLRPIEVVMLSTSAEDRQKNKDFPGFQLALQKPKGYEGGRQIIGALWGRKSKDGTKSYLSGFIETPAVPGYKVYIALFNAGVMLLGTLLDAVSNKIYRLVKIQTPIFMKMIKIYHFKEMIWKFQ